AQERIRHLFIPKLRIPTCFGKRTRSLEFIIARAIGFMVEWICSDSRFRRTRAFGLGECALPICRTTLGTPLDDTSARQLSKRGHGICGSSPRGSSSAASANSTARNHYYWKGNVFL